MPLITLEPADTIPPATRLAYADAFTENRVGDWHPGARGAKG